MSYSQNQGRHLSKVFVNPNFQRPDNVRNVVHFNPAFSSNSKIFVNPNFVNRTNLHQTVQPTTTVTPVDPTVVSAVVINESTPKVTNTAVSTISRYCLTRHRNDIPTKTENNKPLSDSGTKLPSNPSTKTRFKLIRKPENIEKSEVKAEETKTIVISKYQTARVTTVKNILNRTLSKLIPTNISYLNKNRTLKRVSSLKRTIKLDRKKNQLRSKGIMSERPAISKLKKCNIPCPLYRKFGQCLRRDRGSCMFLHDKKHVKVCKLFLKGLCFKTNCLLSHETSSQNMPTCHFYLKGVCAKDNCPYLHVKVNENAKPCSDFLKGFCEKGENCQNQHVVRKGTVNPKKVMRPRSSKDKQNIKKSVKTVEDGGKITSSTDNSEQCNSRYYKDYNEVSSEAGSSGVQQMKPTRCKIGKLPSFIKL